MPRNGKHASCATRELWYRCSGIIRYAVKTGCTECELNTGPWPRTILRGLERSNTGKFMMIRGFEILNCTLVSRKSFAVMIYVFIDVRVYRIGIAIDWFLRSEVYSLQCATETVAKSWYPIETPYRWRATGGMSLGCRQLFNTKWKSCVLCTCTIVRKVSRYRNK